MSGSARILKIEKKKTFGELKEFLLERGYKELSIDSSIDKARSIPRHTALKKVIKKKTKGPVFALTFDPYLPPNGSIQAKHWRSMTSKDKYLAEVFKKPPLVAFKRQKISDNI